VVWTLKSLFVVDEYYWSSTSSFFRKKKWVVVIVVVVVLFSSVKKKGVENVTLFPQRMDPTWDLFRSTSHTGGGTHRARKGRRRQ
tara:strand:- start:7 stop:261 length:255 start_codon:yes stop_codon:yes gene_type:complete